MQFFTHDTPIEGRGKLTDRLAAELRTGKKVLWLVSGGSNVPVAVAAMKALRAADLQNLTISLCDERYGRERHMDSNLFRLEQAGFKPGAAKLIGVLQDSLSLEDTADAFDKKIGDAFDAADVVIAQIGMGADGHIAGILPKSAAAEINDRMAVSYDGGLHKRITLTPHALLRVDAAYVFAYGAEKRKALIILRDQAVPMREQPAQLLKQLKEVYVFNDQIGDTQ
jgi:6-phosphogluconolactonase/glucosamine-6-phosphate isomerase/deaminase